MRKLTLVGCLMGSVALSGCTSAPPKGSGGLAEHNAAQLPPVMPDQSVSPQHGLRFELHLAERHLDQLVLEGAELCFPATVVQARHRNTRILRELQGRLDFDAANDLIVQRRLLAQLERQLDNVKQNEICVLPGVPGQNTPGDMGKRIDKLLNADNQFAFDSSELNPKYVGRLSEAAQLLLDRPGYRLRITGHADAIGDPGYNQELSLQRAQKVARYLQIFGLPAKRMDVTAIGIDAPLVPGTEPATRLTNRRVSIDLIELAGASADPRISE